MGQDPDTIKQQIADTRAGMGDTVDALGYKADVKARAKENVQGKVSAVTDRVAAAKDSVVGRTHDAADHVPSGGDVKSSLSGGASSAQSSLAGGAAQVRSGAGQAASIAQENPLGLAIGAIALGFLGGLLIPATTIENEKIGPVADDLKAQAKEAGQEAYEHGSAVVADAAQAAQDAARTSAGAVKDAARSAAEETTSAVQDAASEAQRAGNAHASEVRESVQDRASSVGSS